jgi:hypothetical protein
VILAICWLVGLVMPRQNRRTDRRPYHPAIDFAQD